MHCQIYSFLEDNVRQAKDHFADLRPRVSILPRCCHCFLPVGRQFGDSAFSRWSIPRWSPESHLHTNAGSFEKQANKINSTKLRIPQPSTAINPRRTSYGTCCLQWVFLILGEKGLEVRPVVVKPSAKRFSFPENFLRFRKCGERRYANKNETTKRVAVPNA